AHPSPRCGQMLDGSYWSRRLSGAFTWSFAFGDFGALEAAGTAGIGADVDAVKGAVAMPGEVEPTTGTTFETVSCGRTAMKSAIEIAATAVAAAIAYTKRGCFFFGRVTLMC